MEGDVGFDPPGEGHSRYDQIGAHVLHRVVMRAQTILRQQSEGVPSLCVDTCGPPHDGLAHVSKASIVPNRHPDVKELVRAGIDTLFAVRPVAVANGGLSLR
jgi:hypothetical protein